MAASLVHGGAHPRAGRAPPRRRARSGAARQRARGPRVPVQAPDLPGRDHAGPVRGAVRRRGRDPADLRRARSCTSGRSGLGALRAAPAIGAVLMSGFIALRPPGRRLGPHVPARGGRVRRVHDRLRAVALVRAVAGRCWPPAAPPTCSASTSAHADAGDGAVRDAGARVGGQPDLHRLVERDRRLRVGRRGAPAGRRAVGRRGRRDHDRGRAGRPTGVFPRWRRLDSFATTRRRGRRRRPPAASRSAEDPPSAPS